MSDEQTTRQWADKLAQAEPGAIVAWAAGEFGERLVLACSFSLEDAVVVDLWARVGVPRLFALDTGRLPEETFIAAEALASRYDLRIEWYHPEATAIEHLLASKGPLSFLDSLDNRHECCRIRKVEPLARALDGRAAWLTGLRRDQATTRTDIGVVEWDAAHRLPKINPLAGWTRADVEAHAAAHGVPVHPLHRRGYPSIGCAPCTRAVADGQHERSGRWWWESPEQKECGLHLRRPAVDPSAANI
ncbi:MAG: phosphoadenylyl-sulfate reductase [Armatimonadetes bacterium]|nr:phosphoadenylyl-sulfate reductase [Armatimonadota bacterium]